MTDKNEDLVLTERDDGSVVVDGFEGGDDTDLDTGVGAGEDAGHDDDDDLNAGQGEEEPSQRNAGEGEEPRKGEEHLSRTERNRLERQRKKEARDRKFNELRAEITARDAQIEELRRNQQVIAQRQHGTEMAQVHGELDKAKKSFEYYDAQFAIAKDDNNVAGMLEATEGRAIAKNRYEEVDRVKQQIEQSAKAPQQQVDPMIRTKAAAWNAKHSWMKPNAVGEDLTDARLVMSLDQGVIQDGFDPRTDAYWQELDRRVEKYLPHRKNSDTNTASNELGTEHRGNGRRAGPTAQGRESIGKTGSGGFILSRGRKEILMKNGDWDDPVRRARMIKAYRDYDREQANR